MGILGLYLCLLSGHINTLLHKNKNTLILQAGSPWSGLVYLSAGEISSASHSPWLWPSQATSSSSCLGLDLGINPWSLEESACLSQASTHIFIHLVSKSLETFLFYAWAHIYAHGISQKIHVGPEWICRGMPDQLTHKYKSKPSYFSLHSNFCSLRRLVLPICIMDFKKEEKWKTTKTPLFMLKYAYGVNI